MPPTPSERMQAGAPFSVGKFWAYSASNSDHGISWAIFTQRLRADNFPPKGSSNSDGAFGDSSTFRYTILGGDARVLTYFTCLSRRLYSRSRARITFRHVKCDRLFSKPYIIMILMEFISFLTTVGTNSFFVVII